MIEAIQTSKSDKLALEVGTSDAVCDDPEAWEKCPVCRGQSCTPKEDDPFDYEPCEECNGKGKLRVIASRSHTGKTVATEGVAESHAEAAQPSNDK